MVFRYPLFIVGCAVISCMIECATSKTTAGFQYLEQKKYAPAIAQFDSAAAVIKPHPQLYFGYFEAYMGINDYENAFKYLVIGLSQFPDDAWLNVCAGHWYMHKGNDSRKALYYYEKAADSRFGKPGNIMHTKINRYIEIARDQIAVDSLESALEE